MTLQQVAKVAGVSISTVSRVINEAPGIAESTAQAVREVMRSLDYSPLRRHRTARHGNTAGQRLAFYVLGGARPSVTPAYNRLLQGASAAAAAHKMDLHIGFVDDPQTAIRQIAQQRPNGLLLHGLCPSPEHARTLREIPTVWLMANAQRPTWGDQVMPDNVLIGRIAAQYLLERGHRHALYFGLNNGWSMGLRALAFRGAMEDAGGGATIINPISHGPSHLQLIPALQELVELCRRDPKIRHGLFISEDWLLRHVYNGLIKDGIQPGEDVDIVSCNNDRPHLIGLDPRPATIDIRFERIAYRGVERLVARMKDENFDDRLRLMIEPVLVPPDAE